MVVLSSTDVSRDRNGMMAAILSAAACTSYCFCSVSMVMANKALAATYNANIEVLLVVIQCAVATVLVELVRLLGYVKYDSFKFSVAVQWVPVNLFFCAMLFTSFMALKHMNVPMVTVFKNLTNIIIVFGDWFFHDQAVSILIILSMVVMVLGALMASIHDLYFSGWGYFWMLANCCATAGYVLYMKFATKTIKLPKFGMVFYNNLLSTVFLTPLAYALRDFDKYFSHEELHTTMYTSLNLFAGSVGVLLNFASLWCVEMTSATTYAVVGSLNVVPTAIIGWVLFKAPIKEQTAMYMCVSIVGGFMYSGAKIQESRRRKRMASMEKPGSPSGDHASLLPEAVGVEMKRDREDRSV